MTLRYTFVGQRGSKLFFFENDGRTAQQCGTHMLHVLDIYLHLVESLW